MRYPGPTKKITQNMKKPQTKRDKRKFNKNYKKYHL